MPGYRYSRPDPYDPYGPRGPYVRRAPYGTGHAVPEPERAMPERGAPERGAPARHAPPPTAPAGPPPELTAKLQELGGQIEALTARVAELEGQLAGEQQRTAEQRDKAESYLDLAQRTQADFVNYKRRVERERGDEATAARADLLGQLLPVLDDLERALDQMPAELNDNAWATGLPLVARQLRLALARAGVQRLGAPGEPFDPHQHEAMGHIPTSEHPAGTIGALVQPGYRLGERLIRPAQVLIAQEPAAGS